MCGFTEVNNSILTILQYYLKTVRDMYYEVKKKLTILQNSTYSI